MKTFKALSVAVLFILTQLTGSAQPCAISCTSNMLIEADKGQEGAIVNIIPASIAGECGRVTYFPASGTFFRIGSHSIIATASTGEKCSFTVTVTDNESPVLSELNLSSERLWPESNRMKKVSVYYTASDNAQDVTSVLSVSSNDITSTTRDWEIVNNHLVRLKSSRLASGEPRIYTIVVTSSDEAGNKTIRTTSIAVSKTMVALKPATGSIGFRN
jgi:hypothetical protein